MRLVGVLLFSLLAFTWSAPAFAQADDASEPGPVVLTDGQDEYPLGLHLEILEDPSGELTIEDVASPEFASRFTPSQSEAPNYSYTDSAYWVRLQLRNQTRMANRWLLEVDFANMQFVDLYSPSPDKEGFTVKQSGILRPISTRDVRYPDIVFELTLPTQSQQTFYLRLRNDASMTLGLTLRSPSAFLAHSNQELLRYGFFFGVMLGLLGYNLFLLFSLRERSYLFLTFFIANMVFFEATYSDYLETYVFPAIYYLEPYYLPLSFSLISVLALLFCHSFLEVRTRIPRLHRLIIAILAVWGALIVLIPFLSYLTLASLMVPWAVVSLAAVLAAGIVSWRRGFHSARFFMIAWIGLLLTIITVLLVRLGLISSTPFSENAYHVGVMWMAVCWSIALSDRINLLKANTESANRDLSASEHRLSEILEGLPLGVVVYDKDQKPSFVNRRVTEILGNPTRGILPDLSAGRTLAQAMNYFSLVAAGSDQIVPIEDMPVYRALQGEPASSDNIEADLVDRRVPLEIWANPIRDETGDVESAVVAFWDITTRKQAEEALRASEQHFRVIVENNFDGIIFMDRDRTLMYVSPSYERLNGMKAEELIGQTGVGFVHPDDRGRAAAAFREALQQPGRRISEEYRIKHQDGRWVWIETNAINLLDDPDVRAVVLNSRDITERKQSEAELAEYRKRLELLVKERTAQLRETNERLNDEIMERQTLEELLHLQLEWLMALNQVRQTIGGAADLARACELLSAEILQSFEASEVFLLHWGDASEQIRFFSLSMPEVPPPDLKRIKGHLLTESHLRGDIEQGKTLLLRADQAASLPAPLGTYFQADGWQSLVLVPLVARQSVSGVMGVALPQSTEDFSLAEVELVTTMAHDIADLAEDAQLLDRMQALAATEERNRLARDLHDSVTQVLFSASLVAEVLPQIWRRDPERALQSLDELRRLTRGALAEMRTMLLELRPASVLKTPLPELLAQLTEAVTGRTELPFQLFLEQVPSPPEEVHTTFYRIAQEALNNVVKHAQATQVTVSLSVTPLTLDPTGAARYEVKLAIEDDGVGFYPGTARQEHLGIGIMQERADAIQATLSVDSRPGAGTRVTVIWRSASEDPS